MGSGINGFNSRTSTFLSCDPRFCWSRGLGSKERKAPTSKYNDPIEPDIETATQPFGALHASLLTKRGLPPWAKDVNVSKENRYIKIHFLLVLLKK